MLSATSKTPLRGVRHDAEAQALLPDTGVREDGYTMAADSVCGGEEEEEEDSLVLVCSSCLQLEAQTHFVSAAVEVLPVNQSREGDLDA